jgi:DNA-binding IclR family transcriptional regulator
MSTAQSPFKRMQRDNEGVQVIARAAKILRTLASHPEGLSISQLAREVDLARSTVHRIIIALEAEYFTIVATESGRIHLGPGLAPIAAAARLELHSYLEELASEIDETVDLAILEDEHVLFIDQVAAVSRRLRAVSTVGSTFPLHCTANGKALLARLSPERIERLVPEQLEPFTARTITTREQLLKELKLVRSEGIAYDREEHTEGICAIGIVVPYTRNSMAAITIALPSIRFYHNERNLASALLQMSERIKQNYGITL